MESARKKQLMFICELLEKEKLISKEERIQMWDLIEQKARKGDGNGNGACRDL